MQGAMEIFTWWPLQRLMWTLGERIQWRWYVPRDGGDSIENVGLEGDRQMSGHRYSDVGLNTRGWHGCRLLDTGGPCGNNGNRVGNS
jgi:hypothetical protein